MAAYKQQMDFIHQLIESKEMKILHLHLKGISNSNPHNMVMNASPVII